MVCERRGGDGGDHRATGRARVGIDEARIAVAAGRRGGTIVAPDGGGCDSDGGGGGGGSRRSGGRGRGAARHQTGGRALILIGGCATLISGRVAGGVRASGKRPHYPTAR